MSEETSTQKTAALEDVVALAETAAIEAMQGLFEDVPVEIRHREVGIDHTPRSEVASIITLDGEISGLISLHASEALAGLIARALHGTESGKELSEFEVRDAFGELCNIIAGNIKTQCIETLNLTMEIGLPAVMLPSGGIAVPPPSPDVAAAIIHAKLAYCPVTLYLCLADGVHHHA